MKNSRAAGPLSGREHELAQVLRLLEHAASGPASLLLEGEPGIGKTTIWRLGVARATEAGLKVLSAAPSRPEQGLAFAGLADLLLPHLPELSGRLPAPQLHALRVALRLDDPDVPLDASAIAFATVGSLVALATTEPVLVAVDDVQWLDRPSADALAFALRRIGDHDVRVLLALRREEGSHLAPSLEQALTGLDATLVPVGPLSLGAVQRIVRERTGAALSRPVLARVHETSAGNPLFALELARALDGAPPRLPDGPLPVPAALRELIGQRLAALSRSIEEALQVASLLAEPTAELLAAVLERDVVDLDEAVGAGIVELDDGGIIRFTHPLLASGLADRLLPAARRRLHRRLAATVESLEERALHLVASAAGPDEQVATVVEEAAASARDRGAPAVAADLLESGLALTDPSNLDARRRRLLAASEATRDAGDWRRAEGHARAAVALAGAGRDRAEALLTLAAASPTVQLDAAQEALLHADGDPRVEARAHLFLSDVLFHTDARRSLDETRLALNAAEHTRDPALRAAALAAVAYLEGTCLDGEPLVHLDEAIALERSGVVVETEFAPGMTLATLQMWRDEHEQARAGFTAASAAASARGDAFGTTLADIHLASVEWRAGRWEQSLALAERATAMWEASNDPGGTSVVHYHRAVVLAHLGRVDEARADIARGRKADAPGTLMVARFAWVEGHLALAEGDSARALLLLGPTAATFDEIGMVHPGLRLYLSDAIEAYLAEGEVDAADALAESLVALGARHGVPRATAIGLRGRGLALAARGNPEDAVGALEQAAAALDDFHVPFEHARTWLALGGVLRRARQRRAARETLQKAVTGFEALGASLWAEQASKEIARIGGRRAQGSGELTPSEQRIAELVAEGKTNREVAAELVVADRTVESALTQIYRKLEIRSRTELARRLSHGA